MDFEICSVNFRTNQNPIILEIKIKKINGEDISLEDCTRFNNPVSQEIENSAGTTAATEDRERWALSASFAF